MKKENDKLKSIGKVTLDVKALVKYYETKEALDEYLDVFPEKKYLTSHIHNNKRYKTFNESTKEEAKRVVREYSNDAWSGYVMLDNEFIDYINLVNDFLEEVRVDVHQTEELGYEVLLPTKKDNCWFVPKKFITEAKIYETFDNVSVEEVLLLKGDSAEEVDNALAIIGAKTKNEIVSDIEAKKLEVEEAEAKLELEIKAVERKAELMISEMKLKMAGMMRPLVTTIEGMTDQLHLFESQIYATLSFMGMTIDVEKIVAGKRADIDEPLVIWQDLRYLDEELPKLQLLYDVEFDDFKLLHEIIKDNPVVRDYFLPNRKTITVFKASKKGVRYYYKEKQREWKKGDKHAWTDYTVATAQLEHGGKIALMMRDGDNVYMAWTEEEKIHIKDGRLFYTDKSSQVEAVDYEFSEESDVDKYSEASKGQVALRNIKTMRENYKDRRKKTSSPLARVYLKSIIEGLLERADILRIPEKEDIALAIAGRGHYIRFKSDDLLLRETTYGTMAEVISRGQSGHQKWGEDIYISTKDNGEDRGRGWQNRTRDAHLIAGFGKINLIEYDWTWNARLAIDKDKHLEMDESGYWKLNELADRIVYNFRDSNLQVVKPNYNHKTTDKFAEWEGAYFKYKVKEERRENSHKRPEYDWEKKDEEYTANEWVRGEGYVNVTKIRTFDRPLDKVCHYVSTGVEWEPTYETVHIRENGETRKEKRIRTKPEWHEEHKYIEIDDKYYVGSPITYREAGFEIKEEYITCTTQVYTSVEKRWGDSNANLKIYEGEYINLTLWNSLWLQYAIRNNYVLPYFYNGDFATQLPHLQEMLLHIKKRETEFRGWCEEAGRENLPKDWQVVLTNWRIETGYRNHTKFRAKQFVKHLTKEGL